MAATSPTVEAGEESITSSEPPLLIKESAEINNEKNDDEGNEGPRKPELFGCCRVEKPTALKLKTTVYMLACFEIVFQLFYTAFFLWELFEVSEKDEGASAVSTWGLLYCPSTKSSILQVTLSIFTLIFACFLIIATYEKTYYALRVWMTLSMVCLVGRLTLASVECRCSSNVIYLVWTPFQIYFFEVVRFQHWEFYSTEKKKVGTEIELRARRAPPQISDETSTLDETNPRLQ